MERHDATPLTADEIADRAIDFMESIGPALQPWQATTLRAMLAYPVSTRFAAAPPQHSVREGILADINRFKSRSGYFSDRVILDEISAEWAAGDDA